LSGQFHAPAALPRTRDSDAHWIGGWMDPRAILDVVAKKKKSLPVGLLACSLVTELTELPRLL